MNRTLVTKLNASMVVVLLGLFLQGESFAHDSANLNVPTIDATNDRARANVIKVYGLMTELILGRVKSESWPAPELKRLRDELITIKGEIDEVLEHYIIDGVDVQQVSALHREPRAGRSAAASAALAAGIALLDRASSMQQADDFAKEFYAQGPTNRLYELIGAHADRMDLYAARIEGE